MNYDGNEVIKMKNRLGLKFYAHDSRFVVDR